MRCNTKSIIAEPIEIFAGIDISEKELVISIRPTNEHFQVSNDEKGRQECVERFKKALPTLIVLEATGGLEKAIMRELIGASLPAVAINPKQGRDFAKATGKLAKTDTIDADGLAYFAQAIRPEVRALVSEEVETLNALIVRRKQLVGMLTAEYARLRRAIKSIASHIETTIEALKTHLETLNQEIDGHIHNHHQLSDKEKIICSVPGVGRVTAATLISGLPELGKVNQREISALLGLAPFNKDSGTFQGKRVIFGGRSRVRSVLYMATLVGTKHNPVLKEFYQRLIKKGKKPKVALTACMHKLIIILNTMVKNNCCWQDKTAIVQ